jgi:hypothetical protein
MHSISYQGSRHLDGVALTSGRVQAVFPLRVCEGKHESSRTLKSIRHVAMTSGRMQPGTVRSFSTLKGVWMHDWVVQTKTWDPTSLSWNLHRIFLEHLKQLFWNTLKNLKYMASLIMTATLHDSDFVNRMQPTEQIDFPKKRVSHGIYSNYFLPWRV